jgi:hypothetical protein
MKQIRNRVYLNESELRNMVESTVKDCIINEGNFGRKLRNAALGTAGAAATLYGAGKGIDNTFDYQDNLQQQAIDMNYGYGKDYEDQYLRDHDLEDTPENRREADEWYNSMHDEDSVPYTNESRRMRYGRRLPISEAKLSRIVRNSIHKVLNS